MYIPSGPLTSTLAVQNIQSEPVVNAVAQVGLLFIAQLTGTGQNLGIAITLMVFGFFVLFSGQELINPILFLAGFGLFSAAGSKILEALVRGNILQFDEGLAFLPTVIVVIIGIGGGVLFIKIPSLGWLFFGAIVGAFVSRLPFIIPSLNGSSTTIQIVVLSVFGIMGMVVAYFYQQLMGVIGTCTLGSYSLFSGVDFFVNSGFSATLLALTQAQFSIVLILMIAGFVSLIALGFHNQWKTLKFTNTLI